MLQMCTTTIIKFFNQVKKYMLSEIPESECSPFYQACFHDVLLMVYILTIPGDLFQFQMGRQQGLQYFCHHQYSLVLSKWVFCPQNWIKITRKLSTDKTYLSMYLIYSCVVLFLWFCELVCHFILSKQTFWLVCNQLPCVADFHTVPL